MYVVFDSKFASFLSDGVLFFCSHSIYGSMELMEHNQSIMKMQEFRLSSCLIFSQV